MPWSDSSVCVCVWVLRWSLHLIQDLVSTLCQLKFMKLATITDLYVHDGKGHIIDFVNLLWRYACCFVH